MRKTLLSLLILLGGCTAALAQTDNTFYAKGFAGTNVGFKVAAALTACNPNIQCFIVLDPSLASFPTGTLPTIPTNAHIIDYRGGLPYGNTGLTFLGAWSSTTSYGVNSVVTFNGSSFVSLVSNLNVQPPSTPVSNSTWGLLLAPGSTSVSSINTATNVSFVPCAGTNDTAALNSALALAGHVIPTGFCNITAHLTIFSHTHFDLSKAIISMTPSSPDYILINNAATQSAQRTFSDAVVTAASNTVTSATAAFTSADTGNSINCLTAGDGTYDFHSYIASVTNGTTIVVADRPGATVNPATCSIFLRDNDISVTGGLLQFLGTGVSVNAADDIAKFKTINNLTVRDVSFSDPPGTGAYQLHVLDFANFHGQNLHVSSSQIHQDGVHIVGPARDWSVSGVTGSAGDDLVAITARDTAFDTNDTSVYGTVQGWLIDDVSGSSNTAHGTTVISAPASPIYDGKIRHVRGSQNDGYPGGFNGLASCALIADNNFYSGGWTGTQGLVSNITVEDCGGNIRGAAVQIQTTNGGDIDATDAAGTVGLTGTGKTLVQVGAGQVNVLKIGRQRGVNAQGTEFLNIQTGANVDQLQFGDVQYDGITAGGAYTFAQISGTVGDLISSNIQLKYNTTASNNGVFVIASGGSVNNFSLCHVHVTYQSGSTGAGKIISNAGAIGFLTACDVSDVSPSLVSDNMFFNGSSATLGGYSLNGIQAQNVSTCAAFNGTVGAGTIINTSMSGVTTPCANSLPNSLQLLSVGGSGTATFAAGSAAGTSPGTPTCLVSHPCDSMSGIVDLTMGTATNNGTVLTITNPSGLTRSHPPACEGAAYLEASPYTAIPFRIVSSTTNLTFNLGTAPTASTAYEFVYQCDGN